MKDRTITQERNTSRIRSGLKNETGEAQSEVKLTKTNGVSPFKCTLRSMMVQDAPSFHKASVCSCILVPTMKQPRGSVYHHQRLQDKIHDYIYDSAVKR